MAPEMKPALIIIGSWIAVLIVVAAYQRYSFESELAAMIASQPTSVSQPNL